jgi:hypothetical protein
MANNFKKVIDRLMWAQVAPTPNAHAAAGCLTSDLRSDRSRNPFVYQLVSNTVLNRYNIVTKSWSFVQSPALAGTFGVGGAMVIEGTNDGTNWVVLKDEAGSELRFTTAGLAYVASPTKFTRPRVASGDGTTSLTATMLLRGGAA